VQVRARDGAGNVSAWSTARCVARAVDDRALSASAHWARRTSSAYYEGTYSQTSRYRATLALDGVRVDRVGIVASTCQTCGRVAVFVGSTRVGVIKLYSATRHARVLRMLRPFGLLRGALTLKVVSDQRIVRIDAVALSRT